MTIDVVTAGCFQASLFHRTVESLKCVPGAGIRPKIFEVPFNEGTYTFTFEYTPVNSIWRKEKCFYAFAFHEILYVVSFFFFVKTNSSELASLRARGSICRGAHWSSSTRTDGRS